MQGATVRRVVLSGMFLLGTCAGVSQAQTFNGGSISIASNGANGSPYPSAGPNSGTSCTNGACINVTGLTGSFTSLTLTLDYTAATSQSLASPGILLQSPTGASLDVLSAACGATTTSFTFTLSDSAASQLPNFNNTCPTLASSYKPADYGGTPGTSGADSFPSPGPVSTYTAAATSGSGTFASTFGGLTVSTQMNGVWKLYVVDTGAFGSGTTFSWKLNFQVTGANAATNTFLSAGSPNPSFTSGTGSSVTFTACVTTSSTCGPGSLTNSNPVTTGSVTLHDNTTNTDKVTQTSFDSHGNAILTATFATEGIHDLVANYSCTSSCTGFAASTSNHESQTAVNHATQSGNTFCNNGGVAIQNMAGGLPYPSSIILGGTEPTLTGTIQQVTVTLNNLQSQDPQGLGFALQAPGATTAFEFLSWALTPTGNVGGTGITVTLSDTGSQALPACSTGTCLPSDDANQVGNQSSDSFPAPAPSGSFLHMAAPTGTATFNTEFGGLGASGTWNLYLTNRETTGTPLGGLGSWCLNFTMQANAHPTTTVLTGSPNPALTTSSPTFTATVTSDVTVNGGTVTFFDGTTNLGSGTVTNGTATLTVPGSDATGTGPKLAEGTHHIVASYGGTNNTTPEFGVSSGSFDIRLNKATTETGSQPYVYCDPGPLTIPGLSADSGPALPYPSNIFVTDLPGTVKALTVTLKSFHTDDQTSLISLLVGPGGNNLDFFSLTGGTPDDVVGTFDLTFDDTASGNLGTTDATAGSFKPASYNGQSHDGTTQTFAYPACPPNATDCVSAGVGPPLASNPFTPTNKAAPAGTGTLGNAAAAGVFGGTTASTYNGNGTWSLFMDDAGVNGGGRPSGLNGGWCVNLTQNLPDISLISPQMTHSPTTFTRGQSASFTITATNLGPGPTGIPTLTITDTLPTGLTYTGFSGTGWSCMASGQTVTCTNPNPILATLSSAVTINVSVGTTTADTISNLASSNGTGGDDPGTTANDTTSSGTITVAGTILTINKTHTDPFTQGQVGATYTITVKNTGASGGNSGPGVTVGTIEVTDSLPGGYTVTAVGGTGWTCPNSTVVDCTLNSPLTVGSTSPALTVTLTLSATATSQTNVAILTADTDQIGPSADNTHNDPTTVVQTTTTAAVSATTTFSTSSQTVPLSATVTGNPSVVGVGTVTFTVLNASNVVVGTPTASSTVTAGAASVNYTLPGGTAVGTYFIQAAYSGGTGFAASSDTTNTHTLKVNQASTTTTPSNESTPFSSSSQQVTLSTAVTSPGGTVSGGTVTFTVVNAGNTVVGTATISGTVSSSPVTVNYTLPAGTPAGSYSIQAAYSGSTNFATSSSNPDATLTVVAPPTIAKLFTPATIAVNATTQLSFTITNGSGNTVAATGVAFTDILPTGLTVATGTASGCGGTVTTTAPVTIGLSGGSVSTSCTFSVTVTGAASGQYTNTTGMISSTNGGQGTTSNTASLTVASPPTITKSFAKSPIALGASTTLTLTVTNPNTIALSGLAFTDNLPTGLGVASTPALTSTCGVNPTTTATSVSITGGTLVAGNPTSSCTVSVAVTGTAAGTLMNSVTVTSTQSGTATAPAGTANITVVAPPTISKSFLPSTVALNQTASLNFTITNPSATVPLTGVGFSDTLVAGITVASGTTSNVCGTGTLTTTNATNGTIVLTGGGVAANSSCMFSVTVIGAAAGTQSNTTGAVTSNEGGTGTTSNMATLTVVAPPQISKAFGASSIALNGTTSLTITISNPSGNTVSLTGVGFTDTLPSGLTATTATSSACSTGSLAITNTSVTLITLTGGTIAANGSCTIVVTVTGATSGQKNNVTGAVTSGNGGTGLTASASVTVGTPPSIAKAFANATIPLNTSTTLTLTITNPNNFSLSGLAFTDTLPTGLVIASTPALSNTCNGTPSTTVNSVRLTGGTLAAANPTSSCVVSVAVTGTAAGSMMNSVTVTSTEAGTSSPGTANITVVAPPTISKVFGSSTVALNGTTSLNFTINNPSATVPLTGVGFSDTLVAGITVASGTTNNVCGANSTLTTTNATNGTIVLTGGSVAANSSCMFSVTVTGAAAGSQPNTTGAVTSNEGGTGTTSNMATLTVEAPPLISKAFGASTIALNGTTSLTITITNPSGNPVPLSGVGFTDQVPSGLTVANVPTTSKCGGSYSISGNLITLTGATVVVGTPCTIQVTVTGASAGPQNNTTSAVTSTNGGTGLTAFASLTVGTPPSITKAFANTSIPLNSNTTLTLTISNPNNFSLSGLTFTDTLTGLAGVGSTVLGNTCGGTASVTTNSVKLTGGTLAAAAGNTPSTCVISATVTGTSAGSLTNSVTVTSTEAGTSSPGTANITVVAPPTISKVFSPSTILLNATTSLNFTINNPANNTVGLTGIAFTDPLPAGLTVATSGPAAVCGGSVSTSSVNRTISFTSGTLAAPPATGSTCSFSVTVTGAAAGSLSNTTSTIASNEGGTGLASNAVLTVVAPPSIAKSFNPTAVNLNGASTLTFTVTNPSGNTVPLSGVGFTDNLSALGLSVTSATGTSSVCGGTNSNNLTVTTGAVTLSNTTLGTGAAATCTFQVTVMATTSTQKNNTTTQVTSSNGGTGNAASATLSVSEADLEVVSITATPNEEIEAGTTVTYTIQIKNLGPNAASGVVVTDVLPSSLTFASCTAPGSTSCGATGNTVKANYASLALNGTDTLQIVATVNCTVADETSIANTASVSATTFDPNLANNSKMVTFTASNPKPSIFPFVSTPSLWPANSNLDNVGLSVRAINGNCPAPANFTIKVYSNESDAAGDAQSVGIGTLQLRAKRDANGHGRVYLIVVSATNAGGATGTGATAVVVPHDQGRDQFQVFFQAVGAVIYADTHNGAPPAGYVLIGSAP